jgi:hypothetical protein
VGHKNAKEGRDERGTNESGGDEMSTETKGIKVRYNWLKFMYAYTIVFAGSIGLGFLVAPSTMSNLLGYPAQEPILAGVGYSRDLAFAIASVLGLRAPLKFSPVLLLQLTYKVIWFIAIIIPSSIAGPLPSYAIGISILFATFVVGDLIAIPFRYLFARGQ